MHVVHRKYFLGDFPVILKRMLQKYWKRLNKCSFVIAINPFATGNISVCDCIFEYVENLFRNSETKATCRVISQINDHTMACCTRLIKYYLVRKL